MNLDFIARPLGQFLYFIYNSLSFLDSPTHKGIGFAYGFAIILFTVIIKLVLLPLTVKQYKSSAGMQVVQPLLQEIQKKYKNDKPRLQEETMKLYKEHKVNPAGGCLPLVIQMPIIITLYWIIVQPLKLMLGKAHQQIVGLFELANKIIVEDKLKDIPKFNLKTFTGEIKILDFFNTHSDKLAGHGDLLKTNELINMSFIGLHLGWVPKYDSASLFGSQAGIYIPLLILVILAVVTTFISTKISMIATKKNNAAPQMAGMQNTMMYIAPVMTLFICFSVPAGVVLYWTVGYIFTIFQQMYINKHILTKKEVVKK